MGSGSYTRTNAMQTTDTSLGITTAFLRKMGGLKHGFPQAGYYSLTWNNSRTKTVIASMNCCITNDNVVFSYDLNRYGERKPVTLAIPFTWTVCNYGGQRTWFLCQCGRRVGRIFFKGEQYGCRHCFRLTYQSRRDCQIRRAWGMIYNIVTRLKLNDLLGTRLDYQPPPRPKWMQRQRHRILCNKLQWWYDKKDMAIINDFERSFPGWLRNKIIETGNP